MTDPVLGDLAPSRCGSGSPEPDRLPARRQRPHRAVQLGVRAAPRRHPRAPDRGHRPRPQHPGGATTRSSSSLRWLGLDWDEGPEVGGDVRPVPAVRAERRSTPTSLERLRDAGTPTTATARTEEVDARRKASRLQGAWGTTATAASSPTSRSQAFVPRAARPCCGSGCPTARSRSTTWSAARSPSSPRTCPTSRWCRANGDPLYTLVNPVDDALMEITHVLRGEDLLSSRRARSRCTTRSQEIGVGTGAARASATCRIVMGEGNKKLSKRDPEAPASASTVDRGLPARGPAQLPGAAGLGDRRRPRRVHDGGDGRGLRHPAT